MLGVVKAKVPATVPPAAFVTAPVPKVELARVWPYVIVVVVGTVATKGICLLTGTVTVLVTLL